MLRLRSPGCRTQASIPINIVSRWFGHASIQTTLINLNVLPDQSGMMSMVPWRAGCVRMGGPSLNWTEAS